jgi:hypothetical protein
MLKQKKNKLKAIHGNLPEFKHLNFEKCMEME